MGAAGWHICLDVLDRLLAVIPSGVSSVAKPEIFKIVVASTIKFQAASRSW
jgi:hypothetical protein